MGAGKTTVCQELKKLLPPCAFLDGDWCWDMEPFLVTEETKAMVCLLYTSKKPPEGLIFSRRDIFRIILPLVAEQFLAMFVGMADSVMISSVGEAAVSAVSLVDSVSILLIQLFTALATGGAVVAGQYLGAKNEERARRVSDQLILLIFLISAVVTAALFFLRGVILRTVFGLSLIHI